MSERKSDIENLTGLWTQQSKSGGSYMSAIVEVSELVEKLEKVGTSKVKLMIFTAKERKSEKHPDHNLCVSPFVPGSGGGQSPKKEWPTPEDLENPPF